MRRRTYLAVLGGSCFSLAGCRGSDAGGDSPATATDGSPSSTATATDEPTATTARSTATGASETRTTDRPAPETTEHSPPLTFGETATVEPLGDVTVESVTVQRSVIGWDAVRRVHEPDDGQVLIVQLRGEHDSLRPSDDALSFGLRLDGKRVESESVVYRHRGDQRAVAVGVRDADEATLVLDGSSIDDPPAWSLPTSVCDQLVFPPAFRLRDATIRAGEETTELSLTVTNRGDGDGTFRAVVVSDEYEDGDAPVRFPVPAGETVSHVVRNPVVSNWEPDDSFLDPVSADTRRFAVGHPG